ncbi:Periplasmic component of the Tol biopolymer transport system [Hyella patelloides LEGE 07179]|uniref:Periplasmic component of the Tol biopolymer transport system n=1 Tax=Hyella patelloides LEGE 07179 TaxID=945734 RepID=A0A563VTZ4_9CYAN|nr:TolB family protein [Hyella patelloides]VEP14878.1 Periplasmic component of the Tol biopolymer transport system [Hyella patelloides LEGE 07179]
MKKLQISYYFLLFLILFGLVVGCQSFNAVTPPLLPGGINSNSPEESPAYSSDGNYLVFASDRRGQRDIFLYDLQQNQLVSLPNLNRGNSSQDRPAISADGRYIVYVSTERGKTDIFLYDRETQKAELLTANIKGSVDNPTISGDGRQIAFQASQLGQWKIVVIER